MIKETILASLSPGFNAGAIAVVMVAQDLVGTTVIPNWLLGVLLGLLAWLMTQGVKQIRSDIKRVREDLEKVSSRVAVNTHRIHGVEMFLNPPKATE